MSRQVTEWEYKLWMKVFVWIMAGLAAVVLLAVLSTAIGIARIDLCREAPAVCDVEEEYPQLTWSTVEDGDVTWLQGKFDLNGNPRAVHVVIEHNGVKTPYGRVAIEVASAIDMEFRK